MGTTQHTPGSRHWQRSAWVVYRFLGEGDTLLYVGVTGNWARRYRSHKAGAAWFGAARRVELEHFDRREMAYDREAALIAAGSPRHNRQPGSDRRLAPERAGGSRRVEVTVPQGVYEWLSAQAHERGIAVPSYVGLVLDRLRACDEVSSDDRLSRSILRARKG